MPDPVDIAHQPSTDLVEVDYTTAPAVVTALDDSAEGRRVTRLAARLARRLRWRLVLVPPADGDQSERLLAAARDEQGLLIVTGAPEPTLQGPRPPAPLDAARPRGAEQPAAAA